MPVGARRAHERFLRRSLFAGREEERLLTVRHAVADVPAALALDSVHALEHPERNQSLRDLEGEEVPPLFAQVAKRQLDEPLPVLRRGLVQGEGGEKCRTDPLWVVHSPRLMDALAWKDGNVRQL